MGKIGKTNSLHKCPREDLMITRKEACYLAGSSGVPRGLHFEGNAAKLLSRAHHSFLHSVSGKGTKAARC